MAYPTDSSDGVSSLKLWTYMVIKITKKIDFPQKKGTQAFSMGGGIWFNILLI